MRKWLLIGGTLAFLVAVFAAFLWFQRDVPVAVNRDKPQPASRPAPASQLGSIGRTESGYAITYDKHTGLPQARFRGEQIIPQEGDQVFVEKPEVEFFTGQMRDQVIRIVGESGLVIIPGEGPRIRPDLTATPMRAPTRGEMRNVTVTYFRSREDVIANRPELTLTLNNAYFDSELFEIATESYVDENGRTIPGEEVPVVVRGESFEFDGQGLLIRWDEHSQRLKSLTIYKGHQLVIKRPGRELRSRTRRSAALPANLPQLVAADSRLAVQVAAEQKAAEDRIYRATFHDNVSITQGDKLLAIAPAMHVDFLEHATRTSEDSPQQPRQRPGDAQSAGQHDAAKPNRQTPGVKPEEPIVIRWTGQMTVTPAPQEPLKPESGDDAIIRFAGTRENPVHLYGNGEEVVATWAAYQTQRGFAWVEGTQENPVRLTDADGSILLTPQLRYSQQDGKAVLRGPSSALVNDRKDGENQVIKARWHELAEAYFTTETSSRTLTALVLKGDVDVEHPQLQQFNAGQLRMDFAPSSRRKSSSAQLRQITATDHVYCLIADRQQQLQSIRADKLTVFMAEDESGQAYADRVAASGSVVAGNDLEQIQADSLQADLVPPHERQEKSRSTTRSAELAGLRKLVAVGNVKVKSADGETITADRLQVRQSPQRASWVLIEGNPAIVAQGESLLSGPFIEVDTATDRAITTGGGRLVALDARSAAGADGRPVEVTWTGDGLLDGATNMAQIAGNVRVKYVDSDGSINEAHADRANIELGVKQAAGKKKEERKFAFMSDRYAKRLTLLPLAGKDVRLQSLLPGPDGTIARQTNILGPRVEIFLDETGVQRLELPASNDHPGRLLYIEMPIATRKAVQVDDPFQKRELPGSTAVAWRKMLSYDRATSRMDMTGDIMVRHEPHVRGGRNFLINADRIIADMAEKNGADRSSQALDVSKLTILGAPAHLVRNDTDLTAPTIEIDPVTRTVMARGTQQMPVNVEKGRMTGIFEWVQLNSETSDMKFGRAMATGRQ